MAETTLIFDDVYKNLDDLKNIPWVSKIYSPSKNVLTQLFVKYMYEASEGSQWFHYVSE